MLATEASVLDVERSVLRMLVSLTIGIDGVFVANG
jgi:hypothetical protein